jgi:hypothetical protein
MHSSLLSIVIMVALAIFLPACHAPARNPGAKATFDESGLVDEGSRSPNMVNAESSKASTTYPSSASRIGFGTETTEPVIGTTTPGPHTPIWSGDLDAALILSGNLEADKVEAFDRETGKLVARAEGLRIDNASGTKNHSNNVTTSFHPPRADEVILLNGFQCK